MARQSCRRVIAAEVVHVIPLEAAQIVRTRLWPVSLQQALRTDNIAGFKCLVGEVHVCHVEEALGNFLLRRDLTGLPALKQISGRRNDHQRADGKAEPGCQDQAVFHHAQPFDRTATL